MITFDILSFYIRKVGLYFEYTLEHTDMHSIKIYKYSPTAQAGYEHQLMYTGRTKNLERMCENSLEWVLTHIRVTRESNRP